MNKPEFPNSGGNDLRTMDLQSRFVLRGGIESSSLYIYIYMHSHATFDTVPPGQGPLDPASAAGVSGRGSS